MDLNTLVTGTEAAKLAGVTKQLIRRWRQLGHLAPAATSPRPLFRARDVLAAEARTRKNPTSPRHESRAA